MPTENVHYEGELVIVIGKRAKDVEESDALDYVFGVTIGNDISARDWQTGDTQWWRAKGADTFGPCGPYIVSGLDYDSFYKVRSADVPVPFGEEAKAMSCPLAIVP